MRARSNLLGLLPCMYFILYTISCFMRLDSNSRLPDVVLFRKQIFIIIGPSKLINHSQLTRTWVKCSSPKTLPSQDLLNRYFYFITTTNSSLACFCLIEMYSFFLLSSFVFKAALLIHIGYEYLIHVPYNSPI